MADGIEGKVIDGTEDGSESSIRWTIEKIANPYPKEHHPMEIWANLELDKIRKEACLCLNCESMNDSPPYSTCYVAKKIFELCTYYDMAMAITRCGYHMPNGELKYKPIETKIKSAQDEGFPSEPE